MKNKDFSLILNGFRFLSVFKLKLTGQKSTPCDISTAVLLLKDAINTNQTGYTQIKVNNTRTTMITVSMMISSIDFLFFM